METSMNTLDLDKKSRGTNLRFIKSVCVFYTMVYAHIRICVIRCLPPFWVPIKHFTDLTALLSSFCLALGPITHCRASLFFIKLLWEHGKSQRGRSWGEAVLRSQTFRMTAEGLECMVAFIGQGLPMRPFDRHVKQPITVRFRSASRFGAWECRHNNRQLTVWTLWRILKILCLEL